MTSAQALVLGVVQGLTEFLPVSSSAHLILVPYFFGWPDQGLAFDAVLHLGTLAALLVYFRRELMGLVSGALSRRLLALLIVATIPGAVAGLLLGSYIEHRFRSPLVIATTTALWGLVLWIADRRAAPPAPDGREPLERVGWTEGLAVGVAQALALVPGTSRSGITITTGLLAGLDRATAARFAFLLGIPITAGAGAHEALKLARAGVPAEDAGLLLIGLVAAFASGLFAVWFLVSYLKRRTLVPFVVYRLLLAALLFVLIFAR